MALGPNQQGHDDQQLPEPAKPRSNAEVAEALQASGMVDELLARVDSGQMQITGDGGLIPGLIKPALKRGLKDELTDRLAVTRATGSGTAECPQRVELENGGLRGWGRSI